jgi:hypothetical protein
MTSIDKEPEIIEINLPCDYSYGHPIKWFNYRCTNPICQSDEGGPEQYDKPNKVYLILKCWNCTRNLTENSQ